MTKIQVLGSGCAKCTKTAELIQSVADENHVDVQVTKETNPETMMRYGVMSTPAVVVNDQLVHSGSIPDRDNITEWLKNNT